MLQLLFTTFKPPEPIVGKLLEPTEKFSTFISWASVAAEFALLLAVVSIIIWYKKRRRGVESRTEIVALKKNKRALLEEVKLTIVFAFGLSVVVAMILWL